MLKIFTSIVIVFSFTNYTLSQVNLSDSLVAHFPLNGNADDVSQYNIDGTINNCVVTSDVNGNPNAAYNFNGTSAYVDCSTNNRDISDVVTISAWFKTTMTTNGFIVSKYDFNDKGFHIGIDNGTIRLGGRNSVGNYSNTGAGQTQVDDGVWHHLLGVIDGNTWKVYVDCNLESTLTTSFNNLSLTSNEPLTIGMFSLGDQGDYKYFDGDIDEVRVYNRTLTTDEMDILCNRETYTKTIEEKAEEKSISIYPNPFEDKVTVKSNSAINNIKLYSTDGKVLFEKNITHNSFNEELDLNFLSSGFYYVKVNDEMIKKIVK